mgnify:CR=1 FL=1
METTYIQEKGPVTTSRGHSQKKSTPFFKGIPIQKKLAIGSSNDAYEVEADRVADQVVGMSEGQINTSPKTGALVQRKCAACSQEEEIQKKPIADSITPLVQKAGMKSSGGGMASTSLTQQINSSMGGGHNMDSSTKGFMESRFGSNFSDVKIHTGSQAVQMSRDLNAQAFAVGNDVYFNEGKYNPSSTTGKHLLAHELTHTLQQGIGLNRKIQRYHHEDCDTKLDLKPHIWPADHLAKTMVSNSITELSKGTISARVNGLLTKYFRSNSASTVKTVLGVYNKIKAAFDADKYTYECETGCTSGNAYTYKVWSDIHLCMDHWRGKANKCLASVIIHEFSHYYGGTTDHQYFTECNSKTAPSSLTVAQAVDNGDSYEGFAYEL